MTERYVVDHDALDSLIVRMEHYLVSMKGWIDDVDSRVAQVQTTWTGEAADAQQGSHQNWQQGAAEMQTALNEIRANARVAHTNYVNAVSANVQMWST